MARGRQKPLDEKLKDIDSQIMELEDRKSKIDEKIKDFKLQKDELLQKQELEQASKLLEVMKSNGISTEEAITKLTGKSDSTETA